MIAKSDIEKMLARLPVLEAEMAAPGAAADSKRFRNLIREHTHLKRVAEKADALFAIERAMNDARSLMDDAGAEAELKDLARAEYEELAVRKEAAEKELLSALLPQDPDLERNAVVEIRAGTGGAEAALFAGDLFRMYSRFLESRGIKVRPVSASPGEAGGYKEIVFMAEGNGAYGLLQFESGGHRVQRVPATEAAGRIHTSAATVAVFPEAAEEDEIVINPEDIRIDIFCSSGPGGQGVNTTYSAVRITHLPSGIVVQSQDERSQHRNKERALSVLRSRLLDRKRKEEEERMGRMRRSLAGSGERSERIRTYNFPQNRVTDHRINLTLYSLSRIIDGEMDELVSALRRQDAEMRIQNELGMSASQLKPDGAGGKR